MKCSARMIGVIYEVLSANVKRPAGLHSAKAGLLLCDPRVAADLVMTRGPQGTMPEQDFTFYHVTGCTTLQVAHRYHTANNNLVHTLLANMEHHALI